MKALIPTFDECLNVEMTLPLIRKTSLSLDKDNVLHTFDYVNGEDKLNIPEITLEMRGLSFLENKKTGELKEYLTLKKYYLVDQKEETKYENIKDKIIDNVTVKEDGSLITFFLHDNTVKAKTRNGTNSVSTMLANEYILKNKMSKPIKCMIEKGFHPMFEITGVENFVVVLYMETKLTLLQVRDNEGTYLNRKEIIELCEECEFPKENIVEECGYTLDELMEMKKTVNGAEGWVILFTDGLMVKIKTDWYINEKERIYNNDFKWFPLLKNIVENTLEDETVYGLPENMKYFVNTMKEKIEVLIENEIEKTMEELKEIKKSLFVHNEHTVTLTNVAKIIETNRETLKEMTKISFLNKYKKDSEARKLFLSLKE